MHKCESELQRKIINETNRKERLLVFAFTFQEFLLVNYYIYEFFMNTYIVLIVTEVLSLSSPYFKKKILEYSEKKDSCLLEEIHLTFYLSEVA